MASSHAKRALHAGGFTIIELLVAIGILSLVAIMGWRGLDSIVRARVALADEMEHTRRTQLTFAQLQSDCAHVAPVTALGGRQAFDAADGRLTLMRTVESDNQPLGFEVVSYRIVDGVLTRHESPATRDMKELDQLWGAARNSGDTASDVSLQSDVEAMILRAWEDDAWLPVAGADLTIATPNAIEVEVKLVGHAKGITKAILMGAN
ncbi:MAG TPA: prepilin-type N-terminal cleavage/methylation domain-containing protein [Burkholderiaceae bacterium]|jgi:general secretion pathway protein J